MALTKMASGDATATIGFLNDAGHLLATTCPETSAFLMRRRNDLMFEHELDLPDKHRQHVCSSCGHIMLLDQGDDLQVQAGQRVSQKPRSTRKRRGKAAQRPRSQTRLGPTKIITCGRCGKLTTTKLPAPSPIQRRKVKAEKIARPPAPGMRTALSGATQEMASQKTTSNANSKKRAKSRKAGLQALLDQSSASRNSKPGLGLSLADFMQK